MSGIRRNIKKGIIVLLVSAMMISIMQHRPFITFAANNANVGEYANVDFTKEKIHVDMVKNSPENTIVKPIVQPSETVETPYQSLNQTQWKEKKNCVLKIQKCLKMRREPKRHYCIWEPSII